jgi:dTDP-4-dehydrorhamnose reductase
MSLRNEYELWGTFYRHPVRIEGCRMRRVDMASADDLGSVVREASPTVILHAAAMIDVDLCERDKEAAERINGDGTRRVATLAAETGARLVYFSTDMVFDGRKGMYKETDAPVPINHYGVTKLLGEELALAHCPGAVVMRLALTYGRGNEAHGSFLDWMIAGLKRRETLRLFIDQFRTPVFAGDVCVAAKVILNSGAPAGTYHIAGTERVNRYEFGERVAELFGFSTRLLQPVRMRDVKTVLPRPADNSLDNSKAERMLKITFRSIRDGLREVATQSGYQALHS